jgi:hypothetical protein
MAAQAPVIMARMRVAAAVRISVAEMALATAPPKKHMLGKVRQASDEKGDRERRRLYLYSRSAISRSAGNEKETTLLLW